MRPGSSPSPGPQWVWSGAPRAQLCQLTMHLPQWRPLPRRDACVPWRWRAGSGKMQRARSQTGPRSRSRSHPRPRPPRRLRLRCRHRLLLLRFSGGRRGHLDEVGNRARLHRHQTPDSGSSGKGKTRT
eukprot:scaffold8340_cov108-Isochrysis_galbana.AAC.2